MLPDSLQIQEDVVAPTVDAWVGGDEDEDDLSLEMEAVFGRRRRWPWIIVTTITLIGLAASSWAVRTDVVAGMLVDTWLASRLTEDSPRIERGTIEPSGLTGVSINNVAVFRPGEKDQPWVNVAQVTVFPDVSALLSGDLAADEIVIDGVEARLRVGEGNTEDLALLTQLAKRRGGGRPAGAVAASDDDRPTSSSREPRNSPPRFPTIRLRNAHIEVDDVAGRVPPLVVDCPSVEVIATERGATTDLAISGVVKVEGYGSGRVEGDAQLPRGTGQVGLTLDDRVDISHIIHGLMPKDVAMRPEVEARGVVVKLPAAVSLRDVTVEGLDREIPWDVVTKDGTHRPRVERVVAEALTVELPDGGFAVGAEQAIVVLDEKAEPRELALAGLRVALEDDEGRQGDVRVAARLADGTRETGSIRIHYRKDEERVGLEAELDGADFGPFARLAPAKYHDQLAVESGTIKGSVRADIPTGHGIIDVEAYVDIVGATVESPVLASERLENVRAGIRGHFRYDPDRGRLTVRSGGVSLGELTMDFEGTLVWTDDGYNVDVSLRSPRLDAQRVLVSLPRQFVPALEGYELGGEFDFSLELAFDSRDPDETLTTDGHIDVSQLRVVRYGDQANIPRLKDDDFVIEPKGLKQRRKIGPGTDDWVAWDDVPPVLPQAITSAEDGKFWKHSGFSPAGIQYAIRANVKEGRLARGGSTITQQVIKNLFLNHERTASRKIQEAFLTWAIEQALDKERIMNIYVNMLHWGPGIYGVREASRLLFDKRPERLSLRESVFLASVLPNPNYFTRLFAEDRVPEDRRVKMRNILNNMYHSKYIPRAAYRRSARLTDDGIVTLNFAPRALADLCGVEINEKRRKDPSKPRRY